MMKKILQTTDPFRFLKLHYKIYTTILMNQMQKALDIILSENRSAAIKNRTILHSVSTICNIIDVSNKLNNNLSG